METPNSGKPSGQALVEACIWILVIGCTLIFCSRKFQLDYRRYQDLVSEFHSILP